LPFNKPGFYLVGGIVMAGSNKTEPKAISVMGNGIRLRVVATALLATCLLGGIGGWAAQAKLAGAVISQGELAISGEIKQIQHVDGGTVVDIPVKSGDFVQKGDTVLRLDDTQARVELDIIRSQIAQLSAMRSRLVAERDNMAELLFAVPVMPELQREELKLFRENQQLRENQKQQLRLQAAQLKSQVDGLDQQRNASVSEEALLRDEIVLQQQLVDKGLVRTGDLRDLKRQIVRLTGTIGDVTAKIAEAQGQISELEIKLMSIDQTSRSEAQKEIVRIDTQMDEMEKRAIAGSQRLDRTTVRAPESGYIYDLQAHTIGGVVASGAAIMSLVPETGDLRVDVKIAPTDIDRIYMRQPARMRFIAFNQQTTPEVKGQVEIVSAATSVDKTTGLPFYKTTLSFSPGDLGELASKLQPGMPVEVYIETEERTVVSYFSKPLSDQIMRAFREE